MKHDYLLNNPRIKVQERDYFDRIINLKGSKSDYERSLEKLLIFLYRHYQERVVVLIDEYDAPIHAGYAHGYYEQIINFMRNFLCSGLKDTSKYLEKSVITGILRVAKESVFSGLNNLGVYTLLAKEFNDKFGFTEEEIQSLLKDFQQWDSLSEVQKWYNGYRFGALWYIIPGLLLISWVARIKSSKPIGSIPLITSWWKSYSQRAGLS